MEIADDILEAAPLAVETCLQTLRSGEEKPRDFHVSRKRI